ncbi:MAG: dihydrodipicolinate synthase family protein [Candidatus Promineifilaceae bacterium]|jgi:dihydrodipicolinate synthase/N-acetylneuraminate lyase
MNLVEQIEVLNHKLTGGISPAMATPINRETGQVALDVIPELVDFLIARGVKGLFVGGTTGEGIFLDIEQRKKLHEAAVSAVAGRVPVLVHAGALTTDTAVELARHAAEIGADAMAAVTPIFYGMHEDALAAYFKAIARSASQVPLFAYDIPQLAVNSVSPKLAGRMFEELPSLAGMKCSNPDAQAIRRLLDVVPDGRILLAGNEAIALGSLALGAAGMISGLATAVPEPLVALMDAFNAGEIEEARRRQRTINRLLATIPAGKRIGAIKAILEARGIPAGPPIAPLPEVSLDVWAEMVGILEN